MLTTKNNLNELNQYGTDNKIFRIGNEFLIRLPRTQKSSDSMLYEQSVLNELYLNSDIQIPQIIHYGKPFDQNEYPFYYSIYKWIDGNDLYHTNNLSLNKLALDLAKFIKELWKVKCPKLKKSKRGNGLECQNDKFIFSINRLNEDFDKNEIIKLWRQVLIVPKWKNAEFTIHGDLLPSNIIINKQALSGIIDFSSIGTGDPAVDLIPAWCIFDKTSGDIFLNELNTDNDTVMRGLAWALSIAVIAIPYYKDTNPVLYNIGLNIINEIFNSYAYLNSK